MSNVAVLKREPDTKIVEMLERWLDMARRGELVSVSIVGEVVNEDGPAYMNAASFEERWHLLGALEYAKFMVNHRGELD